MVRVLFASIFSKHFFDRQIPESTGNCFQLTIILLEKRYAPKPLLTPPSPFTGAKNSKAALMQQLPNCNIVA
jgi:hypothetical protein